MKIEIISRGEFKQVKVVHKNTIIDLGLTEPDEQLAIAETFYEAWVNMKGRGMEGSK